MEDYKIVETNEFIQFAEIQNSFTSPTIYLPQIYRKDFLNDKVLINKIIDCSRTDGILAMFGLPDIHGGVANPIGSVIASHFTHCDGIGPDINCGVRSFALNIDLNDMKNIVNIADELGKKIPAGVGIDGNSISLQDLNLILDNGIEGLRQLGMTNDDAECVENFGKFDSNNKLIGQAEKGRALRQLGSVGGGNHYVEVQKVTEIYNANTAREYGITKINQIVVSIHTGSRGFGFELSKTFDNCNEYEFLQKLGSASNYAIANRSILQKKVVSVFSKFVKNLETKLIYDVGHNNIKKENMLEYGEVLITRKGASSAYSLNLPSRFRNGQPVPVGGSMGTQSYILEGLEESLTKSLGSICHGAGRLFTRGECRRKWTKADVMKQMEGIILKCESEKEVVEEAPCAYKDINVVVDHCVDIGICNKIVKLEPIIVVKG